MPAMSTSFLNRPSHRNSEAFTLVEIMIVVVIIGLLTLLAVPVFQRAKENSENAILAQNWTTFAHVFEMYATEFGEWPPHAGTNLNEEMESRISMEVWNAPPSVGGRWRWLTNAASSGYGPRIEIGYPLDSSKKPQMERLDAVLDDGDLSTGRFRSLTANAYFLRLE